MIDYFNQIPLLALMIVTSLGYALGRITWRGLGPGPAGATLFIALLFGYCGLSLRAFYPEGGTPLTIGTLGFVLFIYSVGFEAGPRFFTNFTNRAGWRLVTVGIAVNVIAVVVAIVFGKLFALDGATVAGLLSGALTSAPTYAAAAQMVSDTAHLSVAFVITYPLGLVGLVLMIQTLPRLLRQDLAKDAWADEEVPFLKVRRSSLQRSEGGPETSRGYEVTRPEVIGKSLVELNLTGRTGCFISRVLRHGELIVPEGSTTLEKGDHLQVIGRVVEHQTFEPLVGREIQDRELEAKLPAPRRVEVQAADACGKSLNDLQIIRRFHCIITQIERGDEYIEPDRAVVLHRNDVVEVSGTRENVRAAARFLGRFEAPADETNIAIYTAGILLGLLIGSIHLAPLGIDTQIGMATGLLAAGVLLGWLGRIGRYSTSVPKPARHLVRDLGILLFIGETGLQGGQRLMEGLTSAPWATLAGALIVTLATVAGTLFLALKVLKLRPLDAWGSLCGGLTSSAALQALRREADTNEVAISYTAAYAVASVLATLAGQVVLLVMG